MYSDVISIEKTGEHFRLIYDVKGRFTVHRITAEEAKVRALIHSQPSKYRQVICYYSALFICTFVFVIPTLFNL